MNKLAIRFHLIKNLNFGNRRVVPDIKNLKSDNIMNQLMWTWKYLQVEPDFSNNQLDITSLLIFFNYHEVR